MTSIHQLLDKEIKITNYINKSKEYLNWKKFKLFSSKKYDNEITNINFSHVSPYNFIATVGKDLLNYNGEKLIIKNKISKFKNTAYSGIYRADSKLIAAGGEEKIVKIFDVKNRSLVRKLTSHKDAIHKVAFSTSSLTNITSFSDDMSIKNWDIPKGQLVKNIDCAHSDFIRNGINNPASPHLWISGAYDNFIKIWDFRTSCQQPIITINHYHPIEDILILSSGTTLFSCGSNYISSYDLLMDGRLVNTISKHRDKISCIAFDSNSESLLSGSYDGYVKMYEKRKFNVIYSIKYKDQVSCIGLSPKSDKLIVGLSDGTIQIRQKLNKLTNNNKRIQISENSLKDCHIVKRSKVIKMSSIDDDLRKFKYKDALDKAIKQNTNIKIAVSLLEELKDRNALIISLNQRNNESLLSIIKFLLRHILNPLYSKFLYEILWIIIDLYGLRIGESKDLCIGFKELLKKIEIELKLQYDMIGILGMVDMIINNSKYK